MTESRKIIRSPVVVLLEDPREDLGICIGSACTYVLVYEGIRRQGKDRMGPIEIKEHPASTFNVRHWPQGGQAPSTRLRATINH